MPADECPRHTELQEYLDGLLDEARASRIELHLSVCISCEQTYEHLKRQPNVFTKTLRSIARQPLLEVAHQASDARFVTGAVSEAAVHLPRGFGAYRLLRKIGEGGMGAVYAAQHLQLGSLVAIKLLKPRFLTDHKSRDRFLREIAAVGKVDHPGIVRARDAGEVDGVHFLAMDYVDGIDLSSLLKQVGRIPIAAACEMISRAAHGLSGIHSAGMVHRDIKPGNLMLSKSGAVQILDLGLALQRADLAPEGSALTETGQLMGTVDYIAPEQADDTHRVDQRADIYGLGATLFALLTGQPPYGRSEIPLLQKLSRLATESPPRMDSLLEDIPESLTLAVEKSLARSPQDRFQTVEEFLRAIQPFAGSDCVAEFIRQSVYFPPPPVLTPLAALEPGPGNETIVLSRGEAEACRLPVTQNSASRSDESRQAAGIQHPQWRRHAAGLLFAGIVSSLLLSLIITMSGNSSHQMTRIRPVLPGAAASGDSPDDRSTTVHPDLNALGATPLEQTRLWNIFSRETRPDDRSAILHQAAEVLPIHSLLNQYLIEQDAAIRAGLLLAISEYPVDQTIFQSHDQLEERLRSDFLRSADPELHSAVDLLLRRYDRLEELEKLKAVARQRSERAGWYLPLLAPTMVVVTGPQHVELGSPSDEPGRMTRTELNEDLRTETIHHTFAISSTEITQELFARLTTDYWDSPGLEWPEFPQTAVTWDEAAQWCNRLSEAEGFPPEEFCYEEIQVGNQRYIRSRPDALQRRGFRLPTEAEWEAACRAGTRESRPFGSDVRWLSKFAFGGQTEVRPQSVGLLKPNPLGLFDMLGNVSEWTHDAIELPRQQTGHVIRGGSASSPVEMLRSAGRYYYADSVKSQKVGFRVARTLRIPSESVTPRQHLSRLVISVGPAWTADAANSVPSPAEFEALSDDAMLSLGSWNTSDRPRRWFRLSNPGQTPVRLDHVPELSEGFAFDVPPDLEIPPSGSTLCCISARPVSRVGTHACNVSFPVSGEPHSGHPQLRIASRFHGPLMAVLHVGSFAQQRAEMSLGNLPPGSRAGVRLYLVNVGDAPAGVRVADTLGDLQLSEDLSEPVLPHCLAHSIHVVLQSSRPGPAAGAVKFQLIDHPASEFRIDIAANFIPGLPCSAVGLFRDGLWLIDWNHDGEPDERIQFGAPGDLPFTGDFDGDGISDLGVFRRVDAQHTAVSLYRRGGQDFAADFLKEFRITAPDLLRVIAMDRNGDGRSEIGYVANHNSGQSLMWMVDLKNQLEFEEHFQLGQPGDTPFVADWTGDRIDDFAVTRTASGRGAGRLKLEYFWSGLPDLKEQFVLSPLDIPLAGDWDGDGDDDLGGWRPPHGNQPGTWQFDVDGDFESDRDLKGFGSPGDIPFALRANRPPAG